MIVNTVTGEILDLAPLRRNPQGRVSRPVRRTYQRRLHTQTHEDMHVAVVLGLVLTIVCLVIK